MSHRNFSDWYERNVDWEGSRHAVSGDLHLIIFQTGRAMVREGTRKHGDWKFFPDAEQAESEFDARLRERWLG